VRAIFGLFTSIWPAVPPATCIWTLTVILAPGIVLR
jgi:hypothetical protein